MTDRLRQRIPEPRGHPNRKWADELIRHLEAVFDSIRESDMTIGGFLITQGGRRSPVTNVTAATATVNRTDEVVDVNRAGTVGLTLPASPFRGQRHLIQDGSGGASGNTITITPPSGIDLNGGSGGVTITTDYGRLLIIYNGTQYTAA